MIKRVDLVRKNVMEQFSLVRLCKRTNQINLAGSFEISGILGGGKEWKINLELE